LLRLTCITAVVITSIYFLINLSYRVLQLTSSSVIPIMYQVPRKTYRDFHSDIFPDTNGCKSELSPKEWFAGKNADVQKLSLDPSKRPNGDDPIIVST
jgi:coronin-7